MGSNWKTTTLADISERIGDGLHGTPKYSDDGEYYFVNGNNLESGAIVYKDSTKRVGLEEYNKHKKELGSSTLLVSINGTIGNVALYNGEEVVLGKSACYINLKKGISKEFVKYILSGYLFQEYIQRCSTGSTIKNVSLKMMRDFAFRIPDTEIEQDKAVELLKLLDQKISLNNQTNQTLEQMAQALFKSWFVDFDPVFDNLLASVDFKLENLATSLPDELKQKAQRRLAALNSLHNAAEIKASLSALAHELQAQLPTKEATKDATQSAVQVSEKAAETPVKASLNANPKILAQHANTHAHFPNEFEHNEQLGWIPKGWSVDNLSKIAKFTSERVNVDDLTFSNYISTDNMHPNRGGITKASKIPEVKTTPGFHPGHILISNIRPYFKKIWLATSSGGRSNDVLGFEALEPKNTGYLFNLLFQDVFFDYMMTTSKGSKMPRGDKKAIMDWMIVIPPDHIQENYSILVKEFYKTIPLKNKEINILTELRDTLLPKLISGELQIPDSANVSDNNI